MYWNYGDGAGFAMRESDLKLITYERGGSYQDTQLYELGSGPYETNDLASQRPDAVERLKSLMTKERKLDGTSKRSDIE